MLRGIIVLIFVQFYCSISACNKLFVKKTDSVLYCDSKSKKLEFSQNKQLFFVKKPYDFAIEERETPRVLKTELNVSDIYFRGLDTFQTTKHHLLDLHRKGSKNKDTVFEIRRLYKIGDYYRFRNFGDSAYTYFREGKTKSLNLDDKFYAQLGLSKIAELLFEYEDYKEAENNIIKAIAISRENDSLTTKLYFLQAAVYSEMSDYDAALNILDLVLFNANERTDLFLKSEVLLREGAIYLKKGDHKTALQVFNQGLALKKQENVQDKTYVKLMVNRAFLMSSKGLSQVGLLEYELGLSIAKEKGYTQLFSFVYLKMARRFKELNKLKEAFKFGKLAIESSEKQGQAPELLAAILFTASLDKQEVLKYTALYLKQLDSIKSFKKNMRTKVAKLKFDIEGKTKENQLLKKHNILKNERLEKERFRNLTSLFILFIVLLSILVISYVIAQERKKLMYKNRLARVVVRVEERQELAKKLHDEIAGDLRVLCLQLEKSENIEVANRVDKIKEVIRDLSHELTSESFQEVSFVDQVVNIIAENHSPSRVVKVVNIKDVMWIEIEPSIKRVLFFSMRELIKKCNYNSLTFTFFISKYALETRITIDKEHLKNSFQDNQWEQIKQRVAEINGDLLWLELEEEFRITLPILNV